MYHPSTRSIARAAIIAAVYALLTLIWPLSFGAVQVRLAEALTILPIFTPDAIPGLFIGCALSGLLGGAVWFDVLFGALTTLMAAMLTRRYRARFSVAVLPPVILNALIVGTVIYIAYMPDASLPALPLTMLSVGAGQAISCVLLGYALYRALRRAPEELWTHTTYRKDKDEN